MPGQRNLEEVLRRFELPLLQYATQIVGSRDRAKDVVQDTFVKFQRNGEIPPDKTATWLFTVCRNRALNACRDEQRLVFLAEPLMETQAIEQPLPFEHIQQAEAKGFLMRIVATLPPRQQEVLQLKFQNDLSYAQIAEITGSSQNSVGVLIHIALRTLRRRYRDASKDFVPFTSKKR